MTLQKLRKAERIGMLTDLVWQRASGILSRKTAVQRQAEAALHLIREQRAQALEEATAARDLLHRRTAERWALWSDREEIRLLAIAREAARQATAERLAATTALARREAAARMIAVLRKQRARDRERS